MSTLTLAAAFVRRIVGNALPLRCALGLHTWERRHHPNFHSHHAVEVFSCLRCPKSVARPIPRERLRNDRP